MLACPLVGAAFINGGFVFSSRGGLGWRLAAPWLVGVCLLAVSTASAAASVRRACAFARPGTFECLTLVRTDIRPESQKQFLANRAALGLSGDTVPAGYGYAASDLQSAYGLAAAAASRGTGETVAIVDAYNDPDAAADLATYRSANGLPACTVGNGCLRILNQNGAASPLPADAGSNGWDVEESLDVDMVSAICPNCDIDLVEANGPDAGDLGTAVNAAVAAGAKFVSNSYGGYEASNDTTYDSEYYDHPGVAVTASAGDDGYGVSYPAASSDVVSVGGTSLSPASNARGWSETAWGSSNGGEGTGSGCSSYDPKPSWQTDTGCSMRTDNDVAADADPNTGVAAYDTYSAGGWYEAGGTSAASPIIAAVFALAGVPAAGTNPASYLYADPSALYDVTSGSDGSCGGSYLCTAKVGYDGPTGLGTPDGLAAFTAPATTTTATTTKLTASANPVQTGQPVTFKATVSDNPAGGSTPSGTVSFSDGSTMLGSAPLSAGQASFTTSSLAAGSHSITAGYEGDSTHESSSDGLAEVVADPPSAAISAPATGQTFAVGQTVDTTFKCTEGTAGPGLASCDDSHALNTASGGNGTLDTSTPGAHTYTVTATSQDGFTGTAKITYTVAAAPSATIASPSSGGTYAVGQSVPTSFGCAEGTAGPGIGSCVDSNGATGGSGSLSTGQPGSFTYTVTATSKDGFTGTAKITYTVAAAPSATIASPSSGGTYVVGQSVPTSFGCAEGTAGPGIGSCVDSNGATGGSGSLSTGQAGTFSYSVTATSKDGQTAMASISYTVLGPPSASISSPANNQTYNLGQSVSTSFSCSEATGAPGISSCTDSNGATGGSGSLSTGQAGTFSYSVTATSKDGQTAMASISYTVLGPPSASIASPANNQTYNLGQSVSTSFSCSEATGAPGISSCVDSNGATGGSGSLSTGQAGTFSYSVTATSKDGQTAMASISYTVLGPPSASISSPANNQTYNLGQSVSTSFSCSEATGAPGISSCVDSNGATGGSGSLSTGQAGTFSYSVTATSKDGQTAMASISYTVLGPPSASISSPANNQTYNLGQSVSTSFSCSEATGAPGISSCKDSNGATGGSGSLKTGQAGTFSYSVTATSKDGQTATTSISYTVVGPPSVKITSPASGGTYALGQTVTTAFSCTDSAGAPGIASCTDSNGGSGSAGTLPTANAGTFTYTVTATSKDGQTTTTSISYTVSKAISTLIAPTPLAALLLGQPASATLTGGAPKGPLSGRTIVFSIAGTTFCTKTTNASGTATCTLGLIGELDASINEVLTGYTYLATFAGDANDTAASALGTFAG